VKGVHLSDSMWCTEKGDPNALSEGALRGYHPLHKARASWKTDLYKAKSCSCRGRTVNQLEAPLTETKSTAHCKEASKFSCRDEHKEECISALDFPIKDFYAVEQKKPQQSGKNDQR